METTAKGALDGKSIAAIMWVIYKQTRRFTSGKVTGLDDTDLNWLDLKEKLFTATAIHCNDIPFSIHGIPLPPAAPDITKRKPEGDPPKFEDSHHAQQQYCLQMSRSRRQPNRGQAALQIFPSQCAGKTENQQGYLRGQKHMSPSNALRQMHQLWMHQAPRYDQNQ